MVSPAAPARGPHPASRLGKIKAGPIRSPFRMIIYGPESVGKTTLAADSDRPIFIDAEDGSSELNVARYPFRDASDGHVPRSMLEVELALEDLGGHDHPYRTLVLDTADRLELLLIQAILDRYSGKPSALNKSGRRLESLEAFGYGKGYQLLLEEWRRFVILLERLRLVRGMNIILIGHAQLRRFINPKGDDYDRWYLRVGQGAESKDKVGGFLKESCDIVGFLAFEEGGAKLDPDATRAKGWNTGRRIIGFERSGAYDAKSRLPLPNEMIIPETNPWAPIADGLASAPARLIELIRLELVRISSPQLTEVVNGVVQDNAADPNQLARFLNSLKRRSAFDQNATEEPIAAPMPELPVPLSTIAETYGPSHPPPSAPEPAPAPPLPSVVIGDVATGIPPVSAQPSPAPDAKSQPRPDKRGTKS